MQTGQLFTKASSSCFAFLISRPLAVNPAGLASPAAAAAAESAAGFLFRPALPRVFSRPRKEAKVRLKNAFESIKFKCSID